MVSPINAPGLPRANLDSLPVGPSGRGRDPDVRPGVAGEPRAVKSEARTIRTPEDGINVLKARLFQRLEQQLGKGVEKDVETGVEFEAPSAQKVAQRVLGFVQQRLLAEARAGADADRLTGLLAQARAGVSLGFAEARDQIEAMGLMEDELSLEIDDSFARIQSGFDDLLERLVKLESPQRPEG